MGGIIGIWINKNHMASMRLVYSWNVRVIVQPPSVDPQLAMVTAPPQNRIVPRYLDCARTHALLDLIFDAMAHKVMLFCPCDRSFLSMPMLGLIESALNDDDEM